MSNTNTPVAWAWRFQDGELSEPFQTREDCEFEYPTHAGQAVPLVVMEEGQAQEPFGYFRAEPFGWTDCSPDDEGAKALYETPPRQPLTRETIRAFFMAHGFTIKEGQTDLKDYVYQAAESLLAAAHGIGVPTHLPADDVTAPMQPVVMDGKVVRFKKNAMVDHLYEWAAARGMGLNEMAGLDFTPEDRMQFAQLIGYSVSGYGSLGYVTDESYRAAAARAEALLATTRHSVQHLPADDTGGGEA